MSLHIKIQRNIRTIIFGCFTLTAFTLANIQANALTITTNTTWTTSQNITGDLVIDNNATLTITGSATNISVTANIDVKPGSTLIVDDQATIKTGSSIIVENGIGYYGVGAILKANNRATFTALNTDWKGIQIWGPPAYGLNGGASAILNHITIEKANIGIATYKTTSLNTKVDKSGIVQADWCTFQDNRIGVDLMQNPQYAAQSPTGPIISIPTNSISHFKFCNFNFIDAHYFDAGGIGLQISDAKGISVLGCVFQNENPNELAPKGIVAFNSDIRVAPGTVTASWGGYCCIVYTQPSKFINMGTGILIEGPRAFSRVLAQQALFQNCGEGMYVLGNQQSILVQNDFTDMGEWYTNPRGIWLYGCSGYTVELNNIEGGHAAQEIYGINVSNSGADYNEIFKNTISNIDDGLVTAGQNSSPNGLTGLELLCNNMTTNNHSYSTGILGYAEGIAKYQGELIPTQNGYTKIAAGNLFANQRGIPLHGSDRIFSYPDAQPFTYGYSNANPSENPVYVSSNVTLDLAQHNPCGYDGTPFISYPAFLTNIGNIETKINAYQNLQQNNAAQTQSSAPLSQTDSERLAGLWHVHQKIIDSMMITFMYLDSTKVSYDSMAMALEAVSLGYFNKIKLAGVYLTQLRYDDAISLLSSIPGNYHLTTDEAEDVLNMRDMYIVIDTLVHNGHNWTILPDDMKQNVVTVADESGAYGTPVARYLLARYEGIFYHPDESQLNGAVANAQMFHIQEPAGKNKIYPNPASQQLNINWSAEGQLTFSLYDLSGKPVLTTAIQSGLSNVNIEQLTSGIYTAEIDEDGHPVYQQKIIKK